MSEKYGIFQGRIKAHRQYFKIIGYKGGPNGQAGVFMNYEIGDIVKLKKQHPCGSQEWEILRVGADFRLKCMGCGHMIMVPRKLVEKNTRGLKASDGNPKQ